MNDRKNRIIDNLEYFRKLMLDKYDDINLDFLLSELDKDIEWLKNLKDIKET